MKTNQNWNENHGSARTFANACMASCGKLIDRLGKAKEAILNEFRQSVGGHEHLLRLALNEAESLAWQTEVPYLVFPSLAMEKAQTVAAWHARQSALQRAGATRMFAA